MKKRTDLIYRNLFIPEWNPELERFFNAALSELKGYSKERGYPRWAMRPPEISAFDGFYEIRKKLPGLEPESLFAEVIENVVILSGLRWCTPPKEEHKLLLFFRRVIQAPKCLAEESLRVHFRDGGEVILRVRERQTALEKVLGEAEKRQKTYAGARDKNGSRNTRPGGPEQNGCHRVGPPLAGGVTAGQILDAVAAGLSDEEIAETLRIPETVVRKVKRTRNKRVSRNGMQSICDQ